MSNPDTEDETLHMTDLKATNQPSASVDYIRNNAHSDEPPTSPPSSQPTLQSRRLITTDQINLLKSSISLVDDRILQSSAFYTFE